MTKEITVTELKKILIQLENEGKSDYTVCFGYDGDFAFTTIRGGFEVNKKNKKVYFYEYGPFD